VDGVPGCDSGADGRWSNSGLLVSSSGVDVGCCFAVPLTMPETGTSVLLSSGCTFRLRTSPQSPRSISCCSLASRAPLLISLIWRCKLSYLRSSSLISMIACSRYRAYSFLTNCGIRWASLVASCMVGKLGLGALRFLDPDCDASPFVPSFPSAVVSSLKVSSFSSLK
jgi:hypothetical protein